MMENVQNAQAYVIEGDRLRELLNLYDDGEKKAKARADLILHLENPVKQVSFPEFVTSNPSETRPTCLLTQDDIDEDTAAGDPMAQNSFTPLQSVRGTIIAESMGLKARGKIVYKLIN
jgi:hypothetical protein